MPIRRQRCEDCGHELEDLIVKSSDTLTAECPECGSRKLSDVMGRTSFALKGNGWERDGYA